MPHTYVTKFVAHLVHHMFYCGHTPISEVPVLYNFNFLLSSLPDVRAVSTDLFVENSGVEKLQSELPFSFELPFAFRVFIRNHSYGNELRLHFHFHANQAQLCTKTRFETEAQGNSEVACWFCITMLHDWFKKLARLFHPIRSQLKPFLSTDRD